MNETVEEDIGADEPSRSSAYLGLVLEGFRPWASGARWSLDGVAEISFERGEARAVTRTEGPHGVTLRVAIPSPALSSVHATVRCSPAGFRLQDAGSRNGTYVGGERITDVALANRAIFEVGRTFFFVHAWAHGGAPPEELELARLRERPRGLRTLRADLEERQSALRRMAKSDVSILLLGPSGAGKELVASAVHAASGRAGPLVAVNCGALPPNLVEAALFGHVKGAFSGAVRDELGFVRQAHGGTLFLDEIGDLPPLSQAVLLRTLQEGEVVPVGTTRPVRVDVRVVAATHQPIEAFARAGVFRADLLARLRGYSHELPALAERREDMGVLLADILASLDAERAPTLVLSARVARALFLYAFPLNIRELHQGLASALVLAPPGEPLSPAHFPSRFFGEEPASDTSAPATMTPPPSAPPPPVPSAEEQAIHTELLRQLELHQGNVTHVAKAMSCAPMQVYRWMRRFQVDPGKYRRGE